MQHRYLPHTQEDIRQMLDVVGVGSLEELYADVPGSVKRLRAHAFQGAWVTSLYLEEGNYL